MDPKNDPLRDLFALSRRLAEQAEQELAEARIRLAHIQQMPDEERAAALPPSEWVRPIRYNSADSAILRDMRIKP